MIYPQLTKRYMEYLEKYSLYEEYDKNIFYPFLEECVLALGWDGISDNRGDKVYNNIISDLLLLDRKMKMDKLMSIRMTKLGITKDDVGIIKYMKK